MVHVGYSEFSFGYAFTENFINSNAQGQNPQRPVNAPLFPNLREEANLGYDIRIDYPGQVILFQFKLPELIKSRHPKEKTKYKLRINTPFFRMPIMRDFNFRQHNTLVEKARDNPDWHIYYATPEIENIFSFNRYYAYQTIHEKTALFSPEDIGEIRDNQLHCIAYEKNTDFGWFCSEPRKIKRRTIASEYNEILDAIKRSESRDMRALIKKTLSTLSRLIDLPYLRFPDQQYRMRHIIDERFEKYSIPKNKIKLLKDIALARELFRSYFGLDMFIAQERHDK